MKHHLMHFETIIKKNLEHPEVTQPVLICKCHAPIRFEVGDAVPEYPDTEHDWYRCLHNKALGIVLTSLSVHSPTCGPASRI